MTTDVQLPFQTPDVFIYLFLLPWIVHREEQGFMLSYNCCRWGHHLLGTNSISETIRVLPAIFLPVLDTPYSCVTFPVFERTQDVDRKEYPMPSYVYYRPTGFIRTPLWNVFKILRQVKMEKLLANLQDSNLSGQREGGRYRSKRGKTYTKRHILHSTYLERDYGLSNKTKHF